MVEAFRWSVEAARLFIDVEVVKKRLAVADYPKHTTTDATGGWPLRTKIVFREMQNHGVLVSGIHWDRIGKATKSFRGENIRIGCSRNWVNIRLNMSLHEIFVRMPELSQVIYIGCATGDETKGQLTMRNPWQDLNSSDLWCPK